MSNRDINRNRLTECIEILLDVDDATRANADGTRRDDKTSDAIIRVITLLQDLRSVTPTNTDRIKAKFAELNAKMADEVYGKRTGGIIVLNTPEESLLRLIAEKRTIKRDFESDVLARAVKGLKEYDFIGESYSGWLYLTQNGESWLDEHKAQETTGDAQS